MALPKLLSYAYYYCSIPWYYINHRLSVKIIMYVLFAFTYRIPVHTAVLPFLSLIHGTGGAAFFLSVTTTASSVGIHMTTVVQDTNQWNRRMVGTMRDNIHATVGWITWNPHYSCICFLMQGHHLKKTVLKSWLCKRQKVNYFLLKIESVIFRTHWPELV